MSAALRAPTEADVVEVVHLMSAHGPEPIGEGDVRRAWTHPGVDLERDARLGSGCYAMVEAISGSRAWLDVRGEPSEEILDWAETRGCEVASRLLSGAWSTHESLLGALEARGFQLVRHSHRMEIDLAGPTRQPPWPDGVEVRTFRPGDERTFYEVELETFADTWEPVAETFEEWTHWMLQPPAFAPDLWYLAFENGDPAGVAICHPHPTAGDLGWVRVLGVRRPWRRRGLGWALLSQAFADFRSRGFGRAGLGVDSESLTGANRLYGKAGMHVAARFDIYEKAVA